MIINLTKHDISVYDTKDVRANRYNPYVYYLNNNEATPKIISQVLRPLNIHYYPANDVSINYEGIQIQGSATYCSVLDRLPSNINFQDDIVVVSGKFAEIALNQLPPEILDILYVPADKVFDQNGKIIGCTSLRKVTLYPQPSYICNYRVGECSKELALKYWNANRDLLNPFELNCLISLQRQWS